MIRSNPTTPSQRAAFRWPQNSASREVLNATRSSVMLEGPRGSSATVSAASRDRGGMHAKVRQDREHRDPGSVAEQAAPLGDMRGVRLDEHHLAH